MPRLIDRLPNPQHVLTKKIIVLSHSRVGTFSLYQALKLLGYTPYHLIETVTHGITHIILFEEALRCKYLGTGKPYGKADFDKWLANYDAIVEISQFFPEELIEYYPDAKFILTERNLDSWERSINNTIRGVLHACKSFPMNAVRHIDPWIEAFCAFHDAFEVVLFQGKGVDNGMEEAKRGMLARHNKAKALAPKGRLLVCKLEDGFGWEQICPFIGCDIPSTPYPIGHAPAEFQKVSSGIMVPRIRNAGICYV